MAATVKMNKWLEMTIVAVCILLPTAVVVPWQKISKVTEFFQYYAISYLSHSGTYSLIYNSGTTQNIEHILGLEFNYAYPVFIVPPIISWFFYPLAFLGFKQALYMWLGLLAFCALGAHSIICKLLGLRDVRRIWIAVLLGAMGPLALAIWKGNLTPILLLAIAGLFINLKKRNFFMASVYQSLLWLQPQLILPLLCFELGLGQNYTVIISSLMAIIGLLISCLMGGLDIINSWYVLFFGQIHNWASCINGSNLQGELLRFGVQIEHANLIAMIAYLLLLIAAFVLGKGVKSKKWQLSILFTVLIPLSLLLSLRTSSIELLLLFAAIVWLIFLPISGWLKYLRAALVMGTLAILFLPLYLIIGGVIENSIYNPFFWLLIIFGTASFFIEKSNSTNANFDN
jgi:hypothetical protein